MRILSQENYCLKSLLLSVKTVLAFTFPHSNIIVIQGLPGEKGEPGTTEIIDYNGNIQEALQVSGIMSMTFYWKSYFEPVLNCVN